MVVTDTTLFAEMILTKGATGATCSDLMTAVNVTCLSSGGGEFGDASQTGEIGVVSSSVVAITCTTLFADMILTEGAVDATRSDLNKLALTSGVAADDATFAGLALTLERNRLELDDWDGTKGTAQAERDCETNLERGTVDASQASF